MTDLQKKLIPIGLLATLGLGALSFQLPDLRFWGLDAWITFPLSAGIMVSSLVIVTYLAVIKWGRLDLLLNAEPEKVKSSKQIGLLLLLFVLFGAGFIIFPAKSFFLGDGRQLLDYMAHGKSAAKSWDVGATHFVNLLIGFLGERSEANAMLAYRSMSIISGFICLTAVLIMSRLIFNRSYKSFFFAFGILSSGQTLLFFGYVENYAPLVSILTVICLYGILVANNKAPLLPLLPLIALATYIHLFGLVLLPAVIYLILRNNRYLQTLRNLSRTKTMVLSIILIVGMAVAYIVARKQSLFWNFNLVPLLSDGFTVEGETLFSARHLLDVFNLLLLLVPGFLIALIVTVREKRSNWFKQPDRLFLFIASVSCIGAVFMLNARLGLPRDWDLFAFVGVPLALFLYYSILSRTKIRRAETTGLLLMILLGLGILIPRVIVERTPSKAIVHFGNYLELDKNKGRNGWKMMIDDYYKSGDTLTATTRQAKFNKLFPEVALNKQAIAAIDRNDFVTGAKFSRRTILLNPRFPDGYHNLGGCFRSIGQLDSALYYLNIADALNSNSAGTVAMIAGAYIMKGEMSRARKMATRAFEIDPDKSDAVMALFYFLMVDNKADLAIGHVRRLKKNQETSSMFFEDAGNGFLSHRKFQYAHECFEIAIFRGMDSTYLQQLQTKYPQLQNR